MECYKCQAQLTKSEHCPSCKADVRVYKKIIHLSNMHYNEALLQAQVRDLSGAVINLKKSLKYSKMNIQARNLLGIIYFEMGETVDALSEWVISRNLKSQDNDAEEYLKKVQSSGSKLDTINQTIKKYNQALMYCKQGSNDLAILQLKKVLSLNPKLIKGHQLLALLYMQEDKTDLAKKSLRSAIHIDGNNTTTLRYLKELNEETVREVPSKKNVVKEPRKSKEGTISYQSGNDTIIKRTDYKDYSPLTTILNIALGIVIGGLITFFLVMPHAKQNAKSEANQAVLEASDTISDKNQNIKNLESEIKKLEDEIKTLKANEGSNQEIVTGYEQLLVAYDALNLDDISAAGEAMANVKQELLSETVKPIYEAVNQKVDEEYIDALYREGDLAYKRTEYELAIEKLSKVVEKDEMYDQGNAIYYLAQSYRKEEDLENAKKYYQKVVELLPNTQRARNAESFLKDIE